MGFRASQADGIRNMSLTGGCRDRLAWQRKGSVTSRLVHSPGAALLSRGNLMANLLGSTHIETLAREESVRGVLVRMALEQAEQADREELVQLEKALELLLSRFQALEDGAP